ncbi:MAG: XRE family transcriptional regulator [Actinomycetota bacterium]
MEGELDVIGRRIRELRADAGLRLSDLAEATGYTAGYISQIERGTTTPSLTAMATLAIALGVEMSMLWEGSVPEVTVTRADERDELDLGSGRVYELLSPIGTDRSFSAMCHQVGGGDEHFRHYGERFAFVLDGTVTFSFAESSHVVAAGETIHYGAYREHTVATDDDEPATILMIAAPAIL